MNFLASLQSFPNIQFANLKNEKKTFSTPKRNPAGSAKVSLDNPQFNGSDTKCYQENGYKDSFGVCLMMMMIPTRPPNFVTSSTRDPLFRSLSLPNSTKAVEP